MEIREEVQGGDVSELTSDEWTAVEDINTSDVMLWCVSLLFLSFRSEGQKVLLTRSLSCRVRTWRTFQTNNPLGSLSHHLLSQLYGHARTAPPTRPVENVIDGNNTRRQNRQQLH